MTPYELTICLHYYCMADDWNDGDFSAPICIPTMKKLVGEGLLLDRGETYTNTGRRFDGTEKLDAFVNALMEVPLPVQKWVMP